MEKAYDIKELGKKIAEEAKKDGLEIAEQAVETLGKACWTGIKSWLVESSLLSENKIDDVVAPFISQLDPLVEGVIAKVDLDKDGK